MASTTPAHHGTSGASGGASGAKNEAKGGAKSAKNTAEGLASQANSPWLKRLGQVGVAAIGVVYLLLAWISLQVAWGGSEESADNTGALQEVAEKPFGEVLLIVMGIGLIGYAVWQLLLAVIGPPSDDSTFKRVSSAAKGVFGASLAVQSLRIGLGGGSKSSSSKTADWTSSLMGAPAGRVLVVIVGLAVIAWSGYLVYKGVKKKFLEKLEGHPGRGITRLGQAGWISRGVAFGVLGILFVVAGVQSQPEEARGLDAALKTLAGQPFGQWILTLVALGLACYAAFQLLTARIHKEG
ncbi:DUF1206 domain-containing protein [Kineosporia sp. J2-2]|uniref:DUF1206 domain-containing protein n=1 Tax=Kineosporia corallincola TaxID=2835133 RepID=A0ABS5TNM2_9ACTN|nr:DUF1206 domain-containing protein [Kineosporia corallincola]MBT0772698.1 DUF1206 domain-containing protein [Kineosporia corallincola]